MTDVAFGGALLAARSLFARGPTQQMIRVIAVAPLASASAYIERYMAWYSFANWDRIAFGERPMCRGNTIPKDSRVSVKAKELRCSP
jgi:hypothetical protein